MNNYNKTLKQLILNKRQRKPKNEQSRHKTQYEDKQNKTKHRKQTKKMSNTDTPKTGVDLDIRGNLCS